MNVVLRAGSTIIAVAALALTTAGCQAIDGKPVAASPSGAPAASTAVTATTLARVSTPRGPSVGTATMRISGSAAATIRYRINGGAEEVETAAQLPWEKQYPVFGEVSTWVSADAADVPLTCSIIMDGKLASFTTEPRPKCEFAYYE